MGCGSSKPKDNNVAASAPKAVKKDLGVPPELYTQESTIKKPDFDRNSQVFDEVDTDGSDTIDHSELTNLFEKLGLSTDPRVVSAMITIVDDNNTGKLSKKEFNQVVYIISNLGDSDSAAKIMFLNADKDFSGTICEKEFIYICKHINYSDDDDKISETFKNLCREGEDFINYNVFCYAVDNILK